MVFFFFSGGGGGGLGVIMIKTRSNLIYLLHRNTMVLLGTFVSAFSFFC